MTTDTLKSKLSGSLRGDPPANSPQKGLNAVIFRPHNIIIIGPLRIAVAPFL